MPPEVLSFLSSCFFYLSRNPRSCQNAISIGLLVFSEFWCPFPYPDRVNLTGFPTAMLSQGVLFSIPHTQWKATYLVILRKHGNTLQEKLSQLFFFLQLSEKHTACLLTSKKMGWKWQNWEFKTKSGPTLIAYKLSVSSSQTSDCMTPPRHF